MKKGISPQEDEWVDKFDLILDKLNSMEKALRSENKILNDKVDKLSDKVDKLSEKQEMSSQAIQEIQGELTENSVNIKIIDNKVKAL